MLHKGNPKPLFHCWINTNFHSTFPIILHKRQIDGADKDPKNKVSVTVRAFARRSERVQWLTRERVQKYPVDFHWVIEMRAAGSGESVVRRDTPISSGVWILLTKRRAQAMLKDSKAKKHNMSDTELR